MLPFLAGYFVWKRAIAPRRYAWLALPFIAAATIVNVYPFRHQGDTEVLSILHLPIALWLVIGVAD